jgi:hypothetical protein
MFLLTALVLLTVFGSAPAKAAGDGPVQALTISKIEPRDGVYLQVSLEFPKGWENPNFQVRVDGRDVNAKAFSGGFSEDRATASFLFFSGKPGTRKISVVATVDGKSIEASRSFDWPGRPFAALLGYTTDRLLVRDKKTLGLVTANVEAVSIKINGGPVSPEVVGREAILSSIHPEWKPGLNTLTIEGRASDGTPVTRKFLFVYLADGMRQGETAMLDYGMGGTRSGPFFSVSVEGDVIALGKAATIDSYTLDAEGWIGHERRLVRELKAVKVGQAKILIVEKPHFLQEKRLKEEIPIEVLPGGR